MIYPKFRRLSRDRSGLPYFIQCGRSRLSRDQLKPRCRRSFSSFENRFAHFMNEVCAAFRSSRLAIISRGRGTHSCQCLLRNMPPLAIARKPLWQHGTILAANRTSRLWNSSPPGPLINRHARSTARHFPSDSGFGILMISNLDCCICSISLFRLVRKNRDKNLVNSTINAMPPPTRTE